MNHQLIGNTLTREANGIRAECTCGWVSAGHFSSMAASAVFMEHQENSARPCMKPLPNLCAESKPEGVTEHDVSLWADVACNGVQWMKNVRDGLCTIDTAINSLSAEIHHTRADYANRRAAPVEASAEVSDERLREFAHGPRHTAPLFAEMEAMARELLAARESIASYQREIQTWYDKLQAADATIAALEPKLAMARLLLAGWRTTWEEGRHSNAPINSTRDWLSATAATDEVKL